VLVDRALAAAIFAAAAGELTLRASGGERALGPALAALIAAPLLWRRRRPVVVALGVLAAVAVQSGVLGLDAFPAAAAFALIAASYALGAYAERREAVAGVALLAAGLAGHAAAFHPDAVPIALLGAGAVPWTTGRIIRAQRLVTREAIDRVQQAERGREGIRAVASGEALLAPTVTRRLIEEFARVGPVPRAQGSQLDELTARELDVLKLLARGMSNAEIAAALVLGETTVKTHVTHVLSKLGLRDRVQAVVLAYESGLVTPGRPAE
jgi:DNA-binding CsgD family transcriptional regulator